MRVWASAEAGLPYWWAPSVCNTCIREKGIRKIWAWNQTDRGERCQHVFRVRNNQIMSQGDNRKHLFSKYYY